MPSISAVEGTAAHLTRLGLALLCIAAACGRPPARTLDAATTTSVQNSGLLAQLLPAYEARAGITVRVHAAGSGRSLQMLADGVVDLVMSHAPEAEQRFLAQHPDWSYRKFAYNHFVVAGPPLDPAGVRGAADVVDAFKRIAGSGERFVSRGDESGTHERERAIWAAAGTSLDASRLIVSGRGMAQALRHADEARAYVLTDDATFRQLQKRLDLAVLFDHDPRLSNGYAVVYPGVDATAVAFAGWLAGPQGRAAIAGFTIDGAPAFTPWPADCAGARPTDTPCR